MYPTVNVPTDASEMPEQVGSKFKFWYNERSQMFKLGREGTGEHWSEKIAAELCTLLGLPHAPYELARWRGHLGTTTPNFVPNQGRLVLGNELLAGYERGYEGTRRFRQRQHTVRRVIAALNLRPYRPPIGGQTDSPLGAVSDIFAGYLLLDAWIGNTDRHHENWGLVALGPEEVYLAPTFDHASSLGRELADTTRRQRLDTRDSHRTLDAYADRATSALYRNENDPRPLSTLDAYREVARLRPVGAVHWSNRLKLILPEQIDEVLQNVPAEAMTDTARIFAKALLVHNQHRILAG
jgi:hypothetical protein